MSLARSIFTNTAIHAIGKVISTAIGLIVVGMIARYLKPEGFGEYSTVAAYLQIFGIILDMGLYVLALREISKPEADTAKIFSSFFTLRLVSAVLILIPAPFIVYLFPYSANVKIGVAITAISYLGIASTQMLTMFFQYKMAMTKVVIAETAGRIVLLISALIGISLDAGLRGMLAAVTIGSLVNAGTAFFFLKRQIPFRLNFDFTYWKYILKETWPIGLSIFFNLIYYKMDTVILSLSWPAETVGLYGAPYKVLEVLITFPAMFAGLITPYFVKTYAEKNYERFEKLLSRAVEVMAMIAIPMAVGTLFLGKEIMILVGGSEFAESGNILKILMFAAAAIFIGNLFANTVVAIGKQKKMLWVYVAVALVSLGLYLYFIPRYSYWAASILTVVSETIVMCLGIYIVLSTTKAHIELSGIFKIIISAAVMGLFLHLVKLPLILALPTGAIVYGSMLFLTKAITIQTLKEIFSSQKKELSGE